MNSVASKIRWILKGKDGTSATLQTLFSRVLIIGVNVLTGVITARVLGPYGRGEQSAMIVWAFSLGSIASIGLPSSITYNFKRYPEQKSEFFSAAILVGTVVGVLTSIVGILGISSWLTNYSAEVIQAAQWIMLFVPTVLLSYIFSATLEVEGNFSASNQIRFLIPSITLAALVFLSLTKTLTPFTAALAYTFNSLPMFFWMLFYLWRRFKPRWQGMGKVFRPLLDYGFRSYGVDLLTILALQADQIFGVGFLPPESMGVYVVAVSVSRMLGLFQTSIVTVLFPKTSAMPVEDVVFITGRAARVCTALTLLAGIGVMFAGVPLLHLLYGKEYSGAISILRVLILEAVVGGTTLVLAQAFMALGKPGTVTILQGIGLGLSLPLMYLLFPIYGVVGIGLALLISSTSRLILILVSYPLVLKTKSPSLIIQRADISFLKHKLLRSN